MSVLVWKAMYSGRFSAWTALKDFVQRIGVEWLVSILVLTSMMLQLVLVVLGARRHLSSRGILRFMVWGAYISADAVAISALGTMMHSNRRTRTEIYGIWAPMLLMHLGGPDAISAYSMADNELWMRHGFNMVYQVSVAVYVIYASSLKGYLLAAAILLLLVGFIKYGERTLALRYGSYPRIVMSSLPISKCMEIKSVAQECKYVVMGEEQVERTIEKKQASSSQKERRKKEEIDFSSLEKVVTIENVMEAYKASDVEKAANINNRGYDLCLSHALFKMYKRRFGSLYFVEGDWKETRDFWVKSSGKEAFKFVEMELKFMYDAVFSKYSNIGFTNWGMLLRFLNTIFLGAAGYLILGEIESRQSQRTVTYVVISVALLVEIFQIWRVIVSDWTRVHLICASIVASRHGESHKVKWCRFCRIVDWCRLKVINIAMVMLGRFEDFVGGHRYMRKIVGGNKYWSNQIPQHCLIETWVRMPPIMCKMARLLPKPDSFVVNWYTKIRHVHNVPVQDYLKDFIFRILKEACSQVHSSEEFRQNVYNFEKDLFEKEPAIDEVLKSHSNLEEVILIWHIATTLCSRQRRPTQQNETENVRISRILSRYCSYLLLSRPNLLPLHPKMARIVYMQLVNQLLDTLNLDSILEKKPGDLSRCNDNLLGSGAKLAERLLKRKESEMWELLAVYWGKLVIYMAVYNKAIFHAECVAAGGEFLSLVWVLLGHMGCGEQSDSAVTKKIEMSWDKDLAVTERNTAARSLSDSEKELAEVKKKLTDVENHLAARESSDREKELDAVNKVLKDRENALAVMEKDLAATKKILSDCQKELSLTKGGLSNPEEELAATKKIVRDLEEELAATKKILRDRGEDFAAMKKNLLLWKGNFE